LPGLRQAGDIVDLDYPPFFIDRVEDEVPPGPQAPGTVGDLGAVGDKYCIRARRSPSRQVRQVRQTYDPGMGGRKTNLTVAVDPDLAGYAERLVQSGKAPDISAVVNDALSDKVGRDGLDRLRETAALADPAKVGRILAHIDAQAVALSDK
jgi:hypothetical protein